MGFLPSFYKNEHYNKTYETKRTQTNIMLQDISEQMKIPVVSHHNFSPKHFYDGIHLNIGVGIRNIKEGYTQY